MILIYEVWYNYLWSHSNTLFTTYTLVKLTGKTVNSVYLVTYLLYFIMYISNKIIMTLMIVVITD